MPSAPQLDEGTLEDGDMGFTGLNELTQPSQLQTSEVAAALNARFTSNKAELRLGLAKLPWTNRVTNASTTPLPFTTIYGGIDFRDPDDVEWTIIAADGKVFRTRECNGATEVPLPLGVVINYPVTFTQCFSGLMMFRGEDPDRPPLVLETIDGGFKPIDQAANTISGTGTENPADGTEAIPPAANGEWIGNRLFIPYHKDWLGISDYLNPTRYAGVRAQARINQGSEDALVRFFKFSDNAGIAFKSSSIYVLNNITADLSTMTLDEVTSEYGLAAAKSCVNVGSDVWFLAEKRGICSIVQTELNKLQGKDVPASLHVKKLIGRINWQYAGNAVAAYYDNKYYLAVPLDEATCAGPELIRNLFFSGGGFWPIPVIPGATYRWTKGANDVALVNGTETLSESGDFTAQSVRATVQGPAALPVTAGLRRVRTGVNNAVLVYDFLQQKWAGADTGSGICVQEWIKATYQGVRRLFALSADGFINLYEELPYDEVGYETFGGNISLSGGVQYDAGANKIMTVTPGALYAYSFGANDLFLRNGAEEHGAREGSFIAVGSEITLVGVAPASFITAFVWPIIYIIELEWIGFDVTLRGWTCQSLARKRFVRCALQLETWYPEFSVYAITEGANELVTVVADRAKNFLTYDRPFDRPAWDQTNANNDHATPFRQDYAIVLGDDTLGGGDIEAGVTYFVEDLTGPASILYNGNVVTAPGTFVGVTGVATFAAVSGFPQVYGPGNYFIPGSAGADPDLTQESTEKLRFPLSCRGKQVQLRIVSTRGRVAVLSAGVEARLADKQMGSHV